MSASVILPQSPKKRKVETELPEKSKTKRRRTDKNSPEIAGTAELVVESEDKKRKEKKDRKRKEKKASEKSEVPEIYPEVEDEDVEFLDAPTSQTAVDDVPSQDISADAADESPIQDVVEEIDGSLLLSDEKSCFYSKRLSLYVPVPAIALATSTSSLLSLHLTPLILTYFPPVGGLVLAFSDPVLSARSEAGVSLPLRPPLSGALPRNPPNETFVQCADQFGVCWVWLTATFLVFAPQPGDTFKGWANIQSESFIGLISYNYFQTSVTRNRIPNRWKFAGPSREQDFRKKVRKGRLQGENGNPDSGVGLGNAAGEQVEDNVDLFNGTFENEDGHAIAQTQVIKVNDVDVTPGANRNKYGLQIDGSLLSAEEEKAVSQKEKQEYNARHKRKIGLQTMGMSDGNGSLMSGALGSQEASMI